MCFMPFFAPFNIIKSEKEIWRTPRECRWQLAVVQAGAVGWGGGPPLRAQRWPAVGDRGSPAPAAAGEGTVARTIAEVAPAAAAAAAAVTASGSATAALLRQALAPAAAAVPAGVAHAASKRKGKFRPPAKERAQTGPCCIQT